MKRFLTGVASIVVLAAIVVGIPVLLLTVAGNPIPTWEEWGDAATQPDFGGTFLLGNLLPIIAWLAWGSFAFSLLITLPAAVRGIKPPRIPGLHIQQRTAFALLGAVVIMFTAFGGAASAATPTSAPVSSGVSYSASQDSSSDVAAPATSAADEAAEAAGVDQLPQYTVNAGDTLWSIASERLGDGKRYTEIAQLNYGVVQPDGGALGADSHWLAGGWVLSLPADASTPAPEVTPAAAPAAELVATDLQVTITAGDTLWDIAAEELGSGDRYPEIFEASKGTAQQGGTQLSDPNLILPGWNVTVPGAGEAVAVPAAEPATPAASPQGGETTAVTASISASDSVAAPAAAEATFASNVAASPVATAGGISALLAASLLGLLGLRRAQQRRRRQAGQRITMPTGAVAATEAELRAIADAATLNAVDGALRSIAIAAYRAGVALPLVVAVRATEETIDVRLDVAGTLAAPFAASTVPSTAWAAPIAAFGDVESLPESPYPALVVLGDDGRGGQLLVNLDRIGALAITGGSEASTGVLAGLALGLASSAWSTRLRVNVAGVAPELVAALNSDRLVAADDPEAVLARLRTRARAASSDGIDPDVTQKRPSRPMQGAPDAEVLLLGDRIGEAVREEILRLASAIPGLAVVYASAGPNTSERWELTVAADRSARLEPLGLVLNAQTVVGSDLSNILTGLRESEQPPENPGAHVSEIDEETRQRPAPTRGGAGEAAVNENTTAEPLDWERRLLAEAGRVPENTDPLTVTGPMVRILGSVRVDGARNAAALADGHTSIALATELVAFLAVNPGATASQTHEALWPGTTVPAGQLDTLAAWTGRWLGSATEEPWASFLLADGAGGYALHPAVRSDWDVFSSLVGSDPTSIPTDRLLAAVKLVTGQPFADVPRRRYGWAEAHRERCVAEVVDAAHELAERALAEGDVSAARIAALVGERIDPSSEIPVRDRLRAEDLADNVEGFEQVVARLNAQLADMPGDTLEGETQDLINRIREHRRASVRH